MHQTEFRWRFLPQESGLSVLYVGSRDQTELVRQDGQHLYLWRNPSAPLPQPQPHPTVSLENGLLTGLELTY